MSLSLEHVDACLPITALKAFAWGDCKLIFQGQGPFFRVLDERTGDVSAEVHVFKRNTVHSFIILSQRSLQDGTGQVQVIVWGGRSLRVVDLAINLDNGANQLPRISLSIASTEFFAPDWIMSGCSSTGSELEKAYLVTANNALLSLQLVDDDCAKYKKAIHLQQLVTSVKSILYSADVIALSATHVLIAAGTVFGEIIVWSCFLDGSETGTSKATGSIHHFFTGHDGSIFGVCISPKIPRLSGERSGRLLATCSDDRTVRIWDISDCEYKSSQDPSAYATDGFELRSTGFGGTAGDDHGVGSESCVAKAFGHIARIWGVYFRPLKDDDQNSVGLVSRGEDCTCVMWNLNWDDCPQKTKFHLQETSSVHHHSGKHIWSLDLRGCDSETVVYTGGADGALKSFTIDESDHASRRNDTPRKVKQSKFEGLKAFAFVAEDCLLACSARSEIQLGDVNPGVNASVTWETLCVAEDLHAFVTMAGLPQRGLALIGNADGLIRLYNHNSKYLFNLIDMKQRLLGLFPLEHQSQGDVSPCLSDILSFLVSFPTDDSATLVTVTNWNGDQHQLEIFTISLGYPFTVASACLLFNGRYLVVGSKLGGLAVYQVSGPGQSSQPLMDDRRVHGREVVNQILTVSSITGSTGKTLEYLLTCGRDGNYCLHEVEASEDVPISVRIVHRTSSSLGQNIEGAYFDPTTRDFMLYGFRAQDFVLRNESQQTDLISIPSGGARRIWAFQPGSEGASDALFLWKEGAILRGVRIRADINRCLRTGAHGREIKAMDALNPTAGDRPLFATGAEDTTVRIFRPSSSAIAGPWGTFECLRVLNTHRSGLQQVSWSRDGRYLFTSAAYEEFFVWRVRSIPSFGAATILMAASPKDEPNSDLRITSFDVLEVGDPEGEQGFLLSLTLSNSTIKIFHFSPTADGHFTLLARGTYMTNCLTQAHFLVRNSSVSLITAATDGYFTLWDLTSVLEPFYTIALSSLTAKQCLHENSTFLPEKITCENRYQIHSNSIKSMELVPLSDTATLIVAGGDDNSLSVSLLRTTIQDPTANPTVVTISIPDAHAASVTTVKILRHQELSENPKAKSILVASSGNDHRVKMWSITVDPDQQGTQGIQIEMLLDRYSSVADISSLGLLRGSVGDETRDAESASGDGQTRLLVCGVGMELLAVKL